MNERIKELAAQAGYHPDVYDMCKPGMEKFAELIIKECADVAYKKFQPLAGRFINEHFGIVE
jgi:hypothetical protein